jgi:sn-glycerol 3-phosphate transport system ATP-binding protein
MASIEIRSVRKLYGKTPAVRGVDLSVEDGEFVVVLGPSGCGKSTLLRMIAGLEDISAGEIAIDGRVVNDVEPARRGCAMVFQNYALYPHMTVAQNIGYALKVAGLSRAERDERVGRIAATLELQHLLARKPSELSGGQRQRVAMGRAMVRSPGIFLFDEPLSNLDAKLRIQMRLEIKRLHRELRTTSVFVTHDQVEAMTLADKLVVMNEGLIEQVGSPSQVFRRPQSVKSRRTVTLVTGTLKCLIQLFFLGFSKGHDRRPSGPPANIDFRNEISRLILVDVGSLFDAFSQARATGCFQAHKLAGA